MTKKGDVERLHPLYPIALLLRALLSLINTMLLVVSAFRATGLRIQSVPAGLGLSNLNAIGRTTLTVKVFTTRHNGKTNRSLTLV